MFVVVVSAGGVFHHLKVFSERADALDFALQSAREGDDAEVFDVPIANDARAAKAGIEMGEGMLIDVRSRRPTPQEIAARDSRERQAQRQQARREAAAWRVIRDLVNEHNALIDRGEPGIAKNTAGEIITKRVWLPERGPRSRKIRQKLVAQVLASEKPDTVRRFQDAMTAILAEERPGGVSHRS